MYHLIFKLEPGEESCALALANPRKVTLKSVLNEAIEGLKAFGDREALLNSITETQKLFDAWRYLSINEIIYRFGSSDKIGFKLENATTLRIILKCIK